jgi:hypothetical protein
MTENKFHLAVLGLSLDGVCTDSFENLSENSLKGDQSNDTKFYSPLFSLVNTFKEIESENPPTLDLMNQFFLSAPQ